MPRLGSQLIHGIERHGRSISYHKSGRWSKKATEWKKPEKKPKVKKAPRVRKLKDGSTVPLPSKKPRFYPAEDIPIPTPSRKHNHRPTRLRSSITPGTVLILLSGRFRGKRVVFLKQLKSGLLLINGPFKINGVPLRRVNQAYVIATSTKVDLTGFKLSKKFNDDYFRRDSAKIAAKKAEKKPKTEGDKKAEGEKKAKADKPKADKPKADKPKEKKEKKEKKKPKKLNKKERKVKKIKDYLKSLHPKNPIQASRKNDQKKVDAKLLTIISKIPTLAKYLGARFSLQKKQFPHLLKF